MQLALEIQGEFDRAACVDRPNAERREPAGTEAAAGPGFTTEACRLGGAGERPAEIAFPARLEHPPAPPTSTITV